MTTTARVARARFEIERRRAIARDAAHHEPARTETEVYDALRRFTRIRPCDAAHFAAVAPLPYALGVLDVAEGLLDRHRYFAGGSINDKPVTPGCLCGSDDWPCEDLTGVLDLLAPEPAADTREPGVSRPAAEAAPTDRVVPPVGAAAGVTS